MVAAVVGVGVLVAYPYRYLILSQLNLGGSSGSNLELRKVEDVPLEGSASRFDYQAIDPIRNVLFIAHLGGDQVVAFDLARHASTRYVHGVSGPHGIAVAPGAGRVYASASGSNEIVAIDEASLQVSGRAPGGSFPDGLAYDPGTSKLFVSDESGGAVIVIDTRTNQELDRIDLGGEVGNTQYDAVSHQILSAAQGRGQLAFIDPQTDQVVGAMDLPGCKGPHGFTIDPPHWLAFVSCEENARLVVVSLSSRTVTASFGVGQVPDVLAFDSGSQRLFVASESGVVSAFQEKAARLTKMGETYLAPHAHTVAVDPSTHRLYFPLEDVSGHPVLRIFEETGLR